MIKDIYKEDRYTESSFIILVSILRVPFMQSGCHQTLVPTKHDENANYVQSIEEKCASTNHHSLITGICTIIYKTICVVPSTELHWHVTSSQRNIR